MKIVEVIWRDSQRYLVQMSLTESKTTEVAVINTVGYLVRRNDKEVVVAQDVMDDDIRGVVVIPVENITKIKIVKK